jgi:hypothetical protein
LWQAPDTQIDTSMQQLTINKASISRQRRSKRLLTLLCKSLLRIPTFPTQRNRGWIFGTHATHPSLRKYFNDDRADNYELWREVSQLFASLRGEGTSSEVIRLPPRREDIELAASLRGVRTSKDRSDTRHQGFRIECNGMIVIPTRGVGNKRVWKIECCSL